MKKVPSWHRRQAFLLATQLPEDAEDARLIVQYMAVAALPALYPEDEQPLTAAIFENIIPFATKA